MSFFARILWIALLWAGSAAAAFDTTAYCSVIKNCMGAGDPQVCTPELYKPNSDIKYTGDFCRAVHDIKARNILPGTIDGRAVYSLLGKQYRTTYLVEGELPVNMQMLDYLLDNLPFVAMLVNAYGGENYEAVYLRKDKNLFRGGNGRSLRGTFYRPFREVSRDSLRNFYWGYGYAQVLMWNLRGDGLLEMDFYDRGPRSVKYRLRAFAFPGSALLNSIMQMSFFHNMVIQKINVVIQDVENAARRFADGELEPIERSAPLKSKEGQRYLREFRELILNSGYMEKLSLILEEEPVPAPQLIKPKVPDYPKEGPVPLPADSAQGQTPFSSPFFAPQ